MRFFACVLVLLSTSAWGQTPQAPSPNPAAKATPQAQPPTAQLYRLVPVDQPATQQYQTVQVQQPQYQTVQLAQQPQYQTVQLAQQPGLCHTAASSVQLVQQPVQQAVYQTAMTTTVAATPAVARTVVLGPGLVSLSLARTGQFLTGTFGKTHVWNIQHTTVRPQVQPSPPVQLVSVSMPQQVVQQPVQVQLVAQPQQQVQVQQQQLYRINAPSEDAPPPPVVQPPARPTPQSSSINVPKKHLFGMLGS